MAAPAIAAGAPATTTEEFKLRNAADLVALCSTPTEEPLFMAAIHLCQGFGAGVYQTVMAVTTRKKLKPVVCPPNPSPSRNEAVKMFLEYMKAHPEYLNDPPAEAVGRFLLAEFPCPKAAS